MAQGNNYSQKAMLVALSISRWTASKRDVRATNKVLTDNNAQAGAARVTKQLIDKAAFEKINSVVNAARAYHNAMTLPWDNEGRRVLSSSLFMEYRARMSEFENEYDAAVREFVNTYPDHIEAAKAKLNGLFDWDDYPTIDELASRFSISVTPEPVPTGNSLHIDIAEEYLSEQRQLIEQRVAEKMKDAHRAIYERLLEVVKHMHKNVEDGVTFRKATIDNIVELCDLIPNLSIEDDQTLKDLAVQAKAVATKYPREDVIGNPNITKRARRDLEKTVQEIEQGMAGFFG